MPPNYGATGTLTGSTNCDSAATGNTGCGLRSNQPGNYGAPYNSNGGGIHMSTLSFLLSMRTFTCTD